MATSTVRQFPCCHQVFKVTKVLLRHPRYQRPKFTLSCWKHFSSANFCKFAKWKTNEGDISTKRTSSAFAELFIDDESKNSFKTEVDKLSTMEELNRLEDLLQRRMSMNISNTVLSTGEAYYPSPEVNPEHDQLSRGVFGESHDFIEEIKGKASDYEDKPVPKLHQNEAYIYGTADPSVPISETPCAGCGAILHCQDAGIPGFVPSQIFLETAKEDLKRTICKRCYVLSKHKIALDVSAGPEEYIKVLEEIKNKRALIVLVLDVLDLPNSIFKGFPDIVGKHRPFYVVGNKVDLLPKDCTGYLNRTKEMIGRYVEEYGLATGSNIRHIALVSAKTGYGIEELVTKLLVDWGRKGDVYVVGCTNVGKSTLFNALLSSDYCRNLSRDFIRAATISNWPGTTLNTLRFPVLNPSPWRLSKRAERLLKDRSAEVEERMLQNKKVEKVKRISIEKSTLKGKIGQTFISAKETALEEAKKEVDVFSDVTYSTSPSATDIKESQSNEANMMHQKIKKIMAKYDAESMEAARYCYDTPGVVNNEQVINLLNEIELTRMLAKRLIMPRTFVMSPDDTMFVTGLGRIDYLQGHQYIYLTVICSTSLPVHVMKTKEAEAFYNKHIGTKELGVPLGDTERLHKLPPLEGKELSVTCIGWMQSAADITLSSIGWVSVTGGRDKEITLKAFTPGGRGCKLRSPSLLEHAVNLKGKRIKGTKMYHPKLKKT